MAQKQRRKKRQKRGSKEPELPMLFSKQNYILMIAGIALVLIGFTGMYIESEMDGFFSLYITPLMVIGGFVTVAVAVLKSDKNAPDESQPEMPQE